MLKTKGWDPCISCGLFVFFFVKQCKILSTQCKNYTFKEKFLQKIKQIMSSDGSRSPSPDFARSPIRATPSVPLAELPRRKAISRNPNGRPTVASAKAESIARRTRAHKQLGAMNTSEKEEWLARKRYSVQKARAKKREMAGIAPLRADGVAPRETREMREARRQLMSSVNSHISDALAGSVLTQATIAAALPGLVQVIQSEVHRYVASINSGLGANALAALLAKNSKDKEGKPTKEESFLKYAKTLLRIQRELFNDPRPTVQFDHFQDADRILAWIPTARKRDGSLYPLGSKISLLGAVCSVGSRVASIRSTSYPALSKVFTEWKEINKEVRGFNIHRNSEAANWLEWPKILAGLATGYQGGRLNTGPKAFKSRDELCIYAVYTLFPPRRVQDYAFMRVHYTTDGVSMESLSRDSNWLVISRAGRASFLVFNRYKTDRVYGHTTFDLLHMEYNVVFPGSSTRLSGLLSDYVRERGFSEGAVLFPKDDGSMFKASSFGARVKALFLRVTEKGVGINVLRHSYISHALDQKQGHGILSGNQRSSIARAMSHNVLTQAEYQRIDPLALAADPTLNAADLLTSFLDPRLSALDAIDVPSDEEEDDFEAAADQEDDSDPFSALSILANAGASTSTPAPASTSKGTPIRPTRPVTPTTPVGTVISPTGPPRLPPPLARSGPPRPAAARKRQGRRNRGTSGSGATVVSGVSRSGRPTGRVRL